MFTISFHSFVDLLCFCSVLCLLCLCARLFICALWSPAGKGQTSWLSFVVSTVSLSLSHWYPGSAGYLIVSIPDLCTLTYFAGRTYNIVGDLMHWLISFIQHSVRDMLAHAFNSMKQAGQLLDLSNQGCI